MQEWKNVLSLLGVIPTYHIFRNLLLWRRNHNMKGCDLKKKGLRPKQQLIRKHAPVNDKTIIDDEPVITQDVGQPEQANSQLFSNLSYNMMNQLIGETTQSSRSSQPLGPLPDCDFIQSNWPMASPITLTTATKAEQQLQRRRPRLLLHLQKNKTSKKTGNI